MGQGVVCDLKTYEICDLGPGGGALWLKAFMNGERGACRLCPVFLSHAGIRIATQENRKKIRNFT